MVVYGEFTQQVPRKAGLHSQRTERPCKDMVLPNESAYSREIMSHSLSEGTVKRARSE